MLEVHQGQVGDGRRSPWRQSFHPDAHLYRFQALDHELETATSQPHNSSMYGRMNDAAVADTLATTTRTTMIRTEEQRQEQHSESIETRIQHIDSGGNLHGPLDQKHSAKLDNVKKSWESYGRRQEQQQQQQLQSNWTETQRSRSGVRQWDVRSDTFAPRCIELKRVLPVKDGIISPEEPA
ncbi:unnamed protein product [Dibothriocephalus latus]|uniref:Uncharacterized protein n=1 Tax=Dibothriocephalus latus TaxID=60516 RepID=A0A3P7KWW9_DIBLA|nr:unnamed protein product [Dibothriocephalus latus]